MNYGALETIAQSMPRLADTERRIAEFVQASPQKVLHLNIAELARQAGTSSAAVVRFCKRIGAEGYSDFKLWLAKDVYQGWNEKICPISAWNRKRRLRRQFMTWRKQCAAP